MARNAACMRCPTMAQNKREGGTVPATHSGFQIALDVGAKEALSRRKLAHSSSVDGWRPQPIPKEHDHLIEMLFPQSPVRHHRPRRNPFPPLTISGLFRSPKRKSELSSHGSSVRWFRDRSNSLLPPPKPDPAEIISAGYGLSDPPSAPDSCWHSGELFSVTLPTGQRRGRSYSSREFQRGQGTDEEENEDEEEWPEYILRLDRKMDRQCTCTGCKDTCTRAYGRPRERNVGAYFDNEFYYNAKDSVQRDGHWWSSRRRREDEEQTTRKNVVCCTEAELYHVPSPPPTSPPPFPSGGSTSVGRSYAPKKRFSNEGSRFNDNDPDYCSRGGRYGLPEWDRVDATSGRVDGSAGRGSSVRRIQTSGSERNPDPRDGDGGYMESDAGGIQEEGSNELAVSPSGTPDERVSLYPDFNLVVPSGLFAEKYNRTSFESGDYLMPYTSDSTRYLPAGGKVEKMDCRNYHYYSERYLAMDSGRPNSRISRDQNEVAPDDTFKSPQKPEIIRSSQQSDFRHGRCQTRMRKEEPGAHRLLTDASINRHANNSFAGEQQGTETKGELEFEENVEIDCKKDEKRELSIASDEMVNSLSIDPQRSEEMERKTASETSKIEIEESQNGVKIDDDLTVAEVVETSGPDLGEVEANVRPKEHNAPPLALRSCSQLDLLLMSPPPQCSLMIEHPYFNITNNYSTNNCNEVPVPVDHKYRCVVSDQRSRRLKEMENKEAEKRRKDFCLLENAVKGMSISKTEANPNWRDSKCNKKSPVSPHVALYKKFVNDYCHTYLPTPMDRVKCIEYLADSS